MPKNDRDDLADALSKLASGDIAPSEHAPSNPLSDEKTPADPNEVAPPPLPSAQMARPSPKPRLDPGKSGARPQRPTTPAPRPAAPSSSSWVPSGEPTPPPAAPDDSLAAATVDLGTQEPTEQSVILDDDDAVIVPAPDAAVFAPRHTGRGSYRRSALYQTIEFRRTIIPILLTCGVLTIAFGMLKYALGEDSPLSELPSWLPVVLFITGALLLALAVTNMLSVRHHLGEHPK